MIKITNFTTKFFLGLLSCIALCLWLVNVVNAQQNLQVVTLKDAGIDESLAREDINYTLPTDVVIVPVNYPIKQKTLNSTDLYRGIYFYTVEVLGFNDIPFHYLVGEDGTIFKGNTGGDERRIRISGVGESMIVIGYITDSSSTKFSSRAQLALVKIISDVVNRNSINPDNIFVDGVEFVRNLSTKSVSLVQKDIFGTWGTSIEEIKSQVKPLYAPIAKSYKAQVDNVILPTDPVSPGSVVEAKISISNLSSNGMYAGTDSALILSKIDGTPSAFFLNNEWASISQASLMDNDEILLPFQEGQFSFNIKVPLFPGGLSEQFELRTLDGRKVESNPVTIALNIGPASRQIVEIRSSVVNAVDVKSQPSSSSATVGQVSAGQRFYYVSEQDNGWLQLELSDGTPGWIAIWFVNFI